METRRELDSLGHGAASAGAPAAAGAREISDAEPACSRCGEPVAPRLAAEPSLRSRLPASLRRSFNDLQIVRARLHARRRGPWQRRLERLRRDCPDAGVDRFAAVCAYFNQYGVPARRENFRRFRRGMEQSGVPLLVVELAVGDDPFELDGVDDVIRVRSPHILWHKERLLQLGIEELLRRGHRKIAWLDADIAFDEPELWPWAVCAELERSTLCQVFEHAVARDHPGGHRPGLSAVAYQRRVGEAALQLARTPSLRRPLGVPLGLSGYGWAARAELLREVPLYQHAVVGGADKMMFLAAVPRSETEPGALLDATVRSPFRACRSCGWQPSSSAYEDHFSAWARRWTRAVDGRYSFASVDLRTFYHGDWSQRRYLARREILLRHEYAPARDVTLTAGGALQWASDKPELHRDVSLYFERRAEAAMVAGG